jgi:hypothetical protein
VRAFFFHIGIAIAVVVCINSIFYNRYAPYNWGVHRPDEQEFAENAADYNLLFIGASRISRLVMPTVFDSVLSEHWDVSSYNLANNGQPLLEQHYNFEQYLQQATVKPKVAVISISPVFVSYGDRDTARSRYWLDTRRYFNALHLIMLSWEREGSAKTTYKTTLHYIQKLLNMGVWRTNLQVALYVGAQMERGYVPLPDEHKLTPHQQKNYKEFMEEGVYEEDMEYRKSVLADDCSSANAKAFAKIIEMFEELAHKHDVYPLFVTPPPRIQYDQYCALKAIADHKRVGFPSPQEFPDIYKKENFFDRTHFKKHIAPIYSEYLAREVNRLLQLADEQHLPAS